MKKSLINIKVKKTGTNYLIYLPILWKAILNKYSDSCIFFSNNNVIFFSQYSFVTPQYRCPVCVLVIWRCGMRFIQLSFHLVIFALPLSYLGTIFCFSSIAFFKNFLTFYLNIGGNYMCPLLSILTTFYSLPHLLYYHSLPFSASFNFFPSFLPSLISLSSYR